MAKGAPGQHTRKGISLMEAVQRFGDETGAEAWFVARRWPDGIACVVCGSLNVGVRKTSRRPTPTYHCNDCKKDFTVKTGTVMHDSKLPLSKWALAFYLYSTNLKGVSSMKLHRDLGITQKAAWHMAHRIRETWDDGIAQFSGTVEVDETYIGGKEKNKHARKRQNAGRGTVGKTPVVGIKERETGKTRMVVADKVDAPTLQGFVQAHTTEKAMVYTDEATAYRGLVNHVAVRHGAGEYVAGEVHTQGIESLWSMMKRGVVGTYHHISPKHTGRYVSRAERKRTSGAEQNRTTERHVVKHQGPGGVRARFRQLPEVGWTSCCA